MGLDMYAFSVPSKSVPADKMVDVRIPEGQGEEIQYWRKHHDLHGWMHRLYEEKDGLDGEFNCTTVRLLAEDLDRLEADIRERRLPATQGFFFGNNLPNVESDEEDLAFVAKAREEIANGKAVYYYSWW
jgi:hypothetical protein